MPDDSTHDPAEASRFRVWRAVTVGAGWLWVLITGVLWNSEPWQRPWITRVPDERVWLALFCAGLLALTLFPWRWKSPVRFLRKAVLVLASGALLFVSLPVICKSLAVERLESMLEEEISRHAEELSMGMRVPSDSLFEKIHDALESHGVGSPRWLKERARKGMRKPPKPTHGHIAASSWPIRKMMADVMIRDATNADYLMAFWKEYFPAITGQDVTLECRREWLLELDALRKEPGLSLPTRQASLLMMALIILTDPPEFESWRASVRDAMIQLREPLIHRWTGHSQTFWYRSLDALLALDPPESWARLTRPMVTEGAAFKQAVEAPMRGLFGNFDVFLPIFENCTDHEDMFLFWQSAGGCLEDHPESFDAEMAERIRTWRRDTLFRWLMALGSGSPNDLTQRRTPALHILERFRVPPFTDSQQQQLISAAELCIQKIQQSANGDEGIVSKNLQHIQYLHPYLDEAHANALCQALVPILLQPEKYGKGHRSQAIQDAWSDYLWFCLPRMTDEQQRLLRDRMSPLMEKIFKMRSSNHIVLYLDAWSTYPAFSRDQWLAMAWSQGQVWRTRPKDSSYFTRPSNDGRILTVPEISEEDIESFARLLEFSLQAQPDKSPEEILSERLQMQVDKRTTTWPWFVRRIRDRMKQLGMHPGVNPEWLRRELKTELADMGLFRIDGELADSLMERARSRKLQRAACLHFPEVSDRFWADILKSPQRAAQAVIDALDGTYKDQILSSLILAIERSSPDDEVIRAVWDALRARSYDGEKRPEVFGALFRLSLRVSENERIAMRREYMDANPACRVLLPTDDLGYHITSAYYVSISRASPNYPMGYDPNALAHPGGGIGIPWADDALSAKASWKTALNRQLYSEPIVETSSHRRELFAYVAHGADLDNQIPRWNQPYRHTPLTAPFPSTPWQKARALHEKRRDLEFE